jgi:hypothetical protein
VNCIGAGRLALRSLGSPGGMAHIGESAGGLHLATIVINVQDMDRAADFWSEVR